MKPSMVSVYLAPPPYDATAHVSFDFGGPYDPYKGAAATRGGGGGGGTMGHPMRKCTECGATDTPQWRQGPSGPQTLCNACGVRHSRFVRKLRGVKKRPAGGGDDMHETSSTATDSGTTISLFSGGGQHGHHHGGGAHTQQPAAQEEESRDCEAALNLLSMATGNKSTMFNSLTASQLAAMTKYPPTALPTDGAGAGGASSSLTGDPELDIISIVKGDTLTHLLPLLTPAQLSHLKALCELFDNSYKELVAAHAARDAVAKILAAKQEESRLASSQARTSSEQLLTEAVAIAELRAAAVAAAVAGLAPPAAKQARVA